MEHKCQSTQNSQKLVNVLNWGIWDSEALLMLQVSIVFMFLSGSSHDVNMWPPSEVRVDRLLFKEEDVMSHTAPRVHGNYGHGHHVNMWTLLSDMYVWSSVCSEFSLLWCGVGFLQQQRRTEGRNKVMCGSVQDVGVPWFKLHKVIIINTWMDLHSPPHWLGVVWNETWAFRLKALWRPADMDLIQMRCSHSVCHE